MTYYICYDGLVYDTIIILIRCFVLVRGRLKNFPESPIVGTL